MKPTYLSAVAAIALAPALAFGQFTETEPNDTKAQANPFTFTAPGNTITGVSTGSSTTTPGLASADNFLITFPTAPIGIYQNRMVITTAGTVGHTGTIRGLTQTAGSANPGTDASAQTSSTVTTPPRYNQWYSFGHGEQLYYRVTGTASTTSEYVSTWERTQVMATDIGSFMPGEITITTRNQGHTTDTDFWVYDANFNAIPGYGNDDTPANHPYWGTSTSALQGTLTREYAPGTYYLALTNFQLVSNMTAPPDDNWQTGTLLDFPGAVVNSSTSINLNMTFLIDDGSRAPLQVQATKTEQYQVLFFKFTVVPEPASAAVLAMAGLFTLRRRTR